MLTLLGFLVRTKGEIAQDYLRRVARCFVLDLRAELAIMSRAVLESALQALEMESVVEDVRRTRGASYPSLIDWINSASKVGVIDEDGRLAAEAVREAGDNAVHMSPGLAPDPVEMLTNLVAVLEQLDRAN